MRLAYYNIFLHSEYKFNILNIMLISNVSICKIFIDLFKT
jgi:hypothetical protein